MLQNFLAEEICDGDYKCGNCKKKGHCTKRLIIYKFPKILIISLKRF